MMTFPTEWKVIIHSMVPVTTNQFFMFPGFCTWRWHQTVGLRGSSHHTQLDPSKTSKNTESSTPGAPESLQFPRLCPKWPRKSLLPWGFLMFLGVGFSLEASKWMVFPEVVQGLHRHFLDQKYGRTRFRHRTMPRVS